MGSIAFTDIARVIEATLGRCIAGVPESLEEVLVLDGEARGIADEETKRRTGGRLTVNRQ